MEPELLAPPGGIIPPTIGGAGVRALIEQLGNEAVDAPNNQVYRFGPGYNPQFGYLLWFRNGILQDTTGGDYAETDARTITMVANMLNLDRMLGISIGLDVGGGGLLVVDRPPAGAGAGPYTTTQNFVASDNLFVWLNGILQIDNALVDYVSAPPNQFTFNAPPPPGPIVSAIIPTGARGLISRETFLNQGPFPAILPVVNTLDKDNNAILVFINGQLQAENFDYVITGVNTINITRVIPGATHSVVVVQIAKSAETEWRA